MPLNCLHLNVEGLKNKLDDNDLIQYLRQFDLICLVETWLDDASKLICLFHDYALFECPAFKSLKGGRNMGGIIVLLRKPLDIKVTRICEDFKFGVILLFDKTVFSSYNKGLLFIGLYIPPHGSPIFSRVNQSVLELLENELIQNDVLTINNSVLLCGDLNARTGELLEYDTSDTNVGQLAEFNDILTPELLPPRTSNDKVINSMGRELITFLKNYSLYIVNGRAGDEIDRGGFTFIDTVGCSVIDYFVCSDDIFKLIKSFKIDNNGSFKHLPLILSIDLHHNISKAEDSIPGQIYTKYVFSDNVTDREVYRAEL